MAKIIFRRPEDPPQKKNYKPLSMAFKKKILIYRILLGIMVVVSLYQSYLIHK